MDQGWIKIHRKMMDNPVVCRDQDYFAVWMYILCNAAYEEHDVWFDGKRITLKPGQLITGRKKMSHFWDISESKVERILKCFEIEQQIEQQANSHGRLITVLNWASYQESEQQTEQPVDSQWTTSEQPVDTTKERKEREERKKEEASSLHSEEAAPAATPAAYDDIAEAWNSLPEPVSKISRITKGSQREKKLHRRILDYGAESVLSAIENVRQSSFLLGGGSKGWVITFDWFVSPENFVKVLEGNYTDKTSRDPPEEKKDDAWDQVLRWMNEKASG